MKILFILLVTFLFVLVFFLFMGSFMMNVDFLSTINTSNKDSTFKDHFKKNLKSFKKSLPAVLFMALTISLFVCSIYFFTETNNKINKEVLDCENSIERATITLLEEEVRYLGKKLEKCKNKKEIDCIYRQAL